VINDVKRVPMFAGAPEAFLEWVSNETTSMVLRLLEPGDTRFRVGLPLGATRADGEAVTGNGDL
jgi:hypothetical protein